MCDTNIRGKMKNIENIDRSTCNSMDSWFFGWVQKSCGWFVCCFQTFGTISKISTSSGNDPFPGATLDEHSFKGHQNTSNTWCFLLVLWIVPLFSSMFGFSQMWIFGVFVLEDRLRALPSFRRLAFEEIHTAGHWGRKLSGGGSSAEITMPLANHLLQFLQTAPGDWAGKAMHAWIMMNDEWWMLLQGCVIHHDEQCFCWDSFCRFFLFLVGIFGDVLFSRPSRVAHWYWMWLGWVDSSSFTKRSQRSKTTRDLPLFGCGYCMATHQTFEKLTQRKCGSTIGVWCFGWCSRWTS